MQIKSTIFIKSSEKVAQCPAVELPEFAFVGRSNVGKSSLINRLMGTPLSKVSATPGKTRLINHFLVNNEWYLVDLPGYGYAKVAKDVRESIARVVNNYLLQRTSLTLLFVLIDSRLEPQQIDIDFIFRLGEQQIPFYIIFTKIDKISATALARTQQQWKKTLKQHWEELPTMLVSSSHNGAGREQILDCISDIIK